MSSKITQKIKVVGTLAVVSLIVAFLGNACGNFESGSTASNGSGDGFGGGACTSSKDFVVIDGAATASVVPVGDVLQNMKTCTYLQNHSQNTLSIYEERKSSFSPSGYVGDVTSAMMMSFAAVAVEHCADLVAEESVEAPEQRIIFRDVDFNSTMMSNQTIESVATRMAQNCWGDGRLPTSEELSIITEEINAMGSVDTEYKAIGICASMLSSLDGILQ